MKHGLIRVGAATPDVRVADVEYNGEQIRLKIDEACEKEVKVLGFPELCVTSYTCSDLFLQQSLILAAKAEVIRIAEYTKDKDIFVMIGFPFSYQGCLYNCVAALFDGKVIGIVPKQYLPNYAEFYEARHFTKGRQQVEIVDFAGEKVPFGMNLLFSCENIPELVIAAEICEDLWVPMPPSIGHALAGATLIINPSASDETTAKENYRRNLIAGQSARLISGYIYASAGEGESTTDLVFSGHNLITENGILLKESDRFKNELIYSEIDFEKLISERRKMSTFVTESSVEHYKVTFAYQDDEALKSGFSLSREYGKTPFVPNSRYDCEKRCDEIIMLQSMGLKKRLMHTKAKNVVIGISGGLDSTLALLVAVETYKMLNLDLKGIIAVTMPCFGTTDRTYNNAKELTNRLGATLLEIPIRESVTLHLKDIDHDINNHNVTYENAQARERTQILMDLSNKYNGLVIGTGDMSELALGWATYNGDHMSMYGVNCSVPKTLVRYLVGHFSEILKDERISDILIDILDTPVSPELLPPKEGEIAQKTEDLVGPYVLHDFFLYYMMRYGFAPSKIYDIACRTFAGDYDKNTIYKWLRTFYWRFFTQQFKRSCIPDGPKVGSISLSPRGDLRMPSDACVAVWLRDLETVKPES